MAAIRIGHHWECDPLIIDMGHSAVWVRVTVLLLSNTKWWDMPGVYT